MKKIIQRLIAFCIVCLLSILSIVSVFADTVYVYYGYQYTLINNYSVSIHGRTDDITYLAIPNTIFDRDVVEISNRAFIDDTELTGVDFSQAKSLSYIGMFAFKGCSSMSGNLVLPYSITYIDSAAFQACSSLNSAVIDANISEIPDQMFYRCDLLSSVQINSNIDKIGSFAFADCPNLEYIELSPNISSIANSAFQNDNITLGVYTDSYAHQYAVQRGIDFILLDAPEPPTEPETEEPTVPETQEPTVIETEEPTVPETQEPTVPETVEPTQPVTEPKGYYLGDVDCNNVVESIDAALIQRLLANLGYSASCVFEHGDVDGDGRTTIIDATLIQRYLGNLYVPYEINKFITE